MPTILIKQLPDDYAEATGLAKHNRSRMPGTIDRLAPAKNSDGRFITGIDEESYVVPSDKKAEIKAIREDLMKRTGIKDLSGTSDYWNEFYTIIYSDKPKVFNTENALDVIAFNMLVANCYVAPTKEAAYTPAYKDAQYYAYTEESETKEEVSATKLRDKATSALLDISENKEKMLLYGQYLEGLNYTPKLSTETIYKMLRAYIGDKDIRKTQNFLKAVSEPIDKLQIKIIVDKAIKNRLLSNVSTGNKNRVFQYGQITLGSTLEEVYKNLSLPDFAPELLNIQKDLEKR